MKQSAANAILSQAVGKGVAIIAWASLVSMAGKSLDLVDYGQFLLLSSFGAFIVILASFGQPQVLLFVNSRLGSTRRTSEHKTAFIRCAKTMGIVSFPVVFIASYGLGFWLSNQKSTFLFLLAWACWTLSSCWLAFFAEEARSVSRMWCAGWFSNSGAIGGAATLMVACIAVAIFYEHITLVVLLAVLGISSLTWLFVLYLKYTMDNVQLNDSQRREITGKEAESFSRKRVAGGTFVTLNSVMTYLLGQSDLWWIAYWYGSEAAGGYGTGAYLARFCSLSGILLTAAFGAKYAGQIAKGEINNVSISIRKFGILSSILGGFTLFTLVISYRFGWLQEVFKFESESDFHVLILLGIGHIIGSLLGFGPTLLSVTGHFRDLLIITGISAIFTASLASPGLFIWGEAGLAAIFSCGYILFTVICYRRCVSVLGINRLFNIGSTRN